MHRRLTSIGMLCLGILMSAPLLPAHSAPPPSPRIMEAVGATATLSGQSANRFDLATLLRDLKADAAAKGSVDVSVKLAVPFAPDKLLTEAQKLQQQRDITAAVNALRQALPQARSFQPQEGVPYVLLQLDRAGLDRLETVPGIVQITRAKDFNWALDFVRLRSTIPSGAPGQEPPLTVVSPAVVGGTDADAGTHPFQVALYEDDDFNGVTRHFFSVAARSSQNGWSSLQRIAPTLLMSPA